MNNIKTYQKEIKIQPISAEQVKFTEEWIQLKEKNLRKTTNRSKTKTNSTVKTIESEQTENNVE